LAGVDESAAAALTRAGMSFDQGKSGVWRRIRESGYQSIHDFIMLLLLVAFLVYPSARGDVQYSDSFARNFMLPLSAAAYSDQPQQCLNRLFPNSTLHRQVTVQCDDFKKDTCSGFTAVLHEHNAIVLSFRLLVQFNPMAYMVKLLEEVNKTIFLNLCSWLFGGRISRYFNDAFTKIWSAGMHEDFYTLRNQYPNYEIWVFRTYGKTLLMVNPARVVQVTGHSLGGSLASLAASFLVGARVANASEVKLVTFGQPRTGDVHFSARHNAQVSVIIGNK
uniref:Lipase_3 domain-containing protein n=1 Tax=Heligmosomoides polygyrus TaxID=6339 RepID=A0A183GJR6_HELPZ